MTDPEPLPGDHPLWVLPNCLLTPMSATRPPWAFPLILPSSRNVRRYFAAEPLLGPVDVDQRY